MDGVITEIDNKIFQNMKSLSFVKYRKKVFDKMRNHKDPNATFKKIFSASIINPKLKEINKKLRLKSKSSLRGKILSSEKKKMNNTSSMFSKKLILKNAVRSFYNKGLYKDDVSTSLSSLIKSNTSFFTTSNFNFNSDRKKLSMSNITNPNINNNRNKINFDQMYFFTISFDKYINDYLHENKYYKNDSSCLKFLEEIRMMRKAKLINHTVSKEIRDLKDIQAEDINNYNRLEFEIENHHKFFNIYFKCLAHYLQELANIKRREKDHLQELQFEKDNLIRNIMKLGIKIDNLKDKIVNLKELKIFLIQVRYGKSIEQLPNEIKKEYGLYTEQPKEKERRFSKIFPKNILSSDAFKKKFFSLYSKKKPIIKKPSITKKITKINNKPIFEDPEEFMSCFKLKTQKIKDNLALYWKNKNSVNETKFKYEKILNENEMYMKNFLPEEERLLNIFSYQKRRNGILMEKLKYIKEMNRTEQNSLKNIVLKLKQILLNIETQLDIKDFITEKNLELFLLSQNDIFDNIDETINITKYILKLIEMVTEVLINNRNKFKNNKKLKEFYRKVHVEIERNNTYNRYKLKVSLALKKKEEKNKNVLHKIIKVRLGSVFQNRKRCYEERIPEKILLKRKLSSKREKEYLNKYEEEKDLFTYT